MDSHPAILHSLKKILNIFIKIIWITILSKSFVYHFYGNFKFCMQIYMNITFFENSTFDQMKNINNFFLWSFGNILLYTKKRFNCRNQKLDSHNRTTFEGTQLLVVAIKLFFAWTEVFFQSLQKLFEQKVWTKYLKIKVSLDIKIFRIANHEKYFIHSEKNLVIATK